MQQELRSASVQSVKQEESMQVDIAQHRFPFCIVWTPIPILTWLMPFVGHMGIATSKGIIRDFAGSFYVSENDMAFGWPTRYWQLDPNKIHGGAEAWDRAIREASDEYKGHTHNLFSDNCHSHVAMALNLIQFADKSNYNTVRLIILLILRGKYVGCGGFLKQWLPFFVILLFSISIILIIKLCDNEMVRLTVELINNALQYVNTVRDRELSLRACKIPVMENLGVTRDHFDTIDLTDNDIRKLENIPLLKRLSTLLMHNNRVQQIMPNIGEVLPSLKTLALTNNNLRELGDIDPLAGCKKLEYLTLIGNPLTHKPQYRFYIIYKVPTVRVLDFKRVKLVERKEANALFKGKKGQKLREQVVKTSTITSDTVEMQGPRAILADDARKIQEAIAAASSLAEVERLQAILQSGHIPESGWRDVHEAEKENNESANNGFVPEHEDEGVEVVKSPDQPPADDESATNEVKSPSMPPLQTNQMEE